jgi:hypothetical protein
MKIFLKKQMNCGIEADHSHKPLIIASDGYPLEQFIGRPVINFLRRILHGDHIECHEGYEERTGIQVA